MLRASTTCPLCEQPVANNVASCPSCHGLIAFQSLWPTVERAHLNEQAVQAGIERARRELKADSQNGAAHYTLGFGYLNLGLTEQALTELTQAASLLPEQHQIAYEIACIQAMSDHGPAALNQLARALQQAPEERRYRYLFEYLQAPASMEQGEVREGVAHWVAAYRLDPEAAPAREALQGFITSNEARLASLRPQQLAPAQQEALRFLNGRARAATTRIPGAPGAPRPLGKTSMRLLRRYAPARAEVLEQMYAARVTAHAEATEQYDAQRQVLTTQNETATLAHAERLAEIRADLPLLAELCAIALQGEIERQREMERRQQEQEARRQEQEARRQEAALARQVTATSRAAVAPPPVKERQIYRTNATYVQGLPVGKKGDVVQLVVTNQRITLLRSAMLDKWEQEIPLVALTEAVEDVVKGFMSKEQRLRLSYRDAHGMVAHAIFTGLKIDATVKAILQARSGR
jgi:tetratricopeptide (TPR) repeat protein